MAGEQEQAVRPRRRPPRPPPEVDGAVDAGVAPLGGPSGNADLGAAARGAPSPITDPAVLARRLGNQALSRLFSPGHTGGTAGLGLALTGPGAALGLGGGVGAAGWLGPGQARTAAGGGGASPFAATPIPAPTHGAGGHVAAGLTGSTTVGPLSQRGTVYADASLGGDATVGADGRLSGVGVEGSVTPVGVRDAAMGVEGPAGRLDARVDDAYYARTGVRLDAHRGDDGTFHLDGVMRQRTGFDGASVVADGPGGTTALGGSFNVGPTIGGGVSYNPDTGSVEARGGFTGGGFQATDLTARHTVGEDTVGLGAREFNTNNTFAGALGWDGQAREIVGRGQASLGWGLQGGQADLSLGGGAVTGGNTVGGLSSGVTAQGEVRLGADGLRLRTGDITNLSENAGIRFGGVQMTDAAANLDLGGVVSGRGRVGAASTDTIIDNASLDLTRNGLTAGVEQIRTGGPRAQDVELGVQAPGYQGQLRAGEVSADTIVDGARLRVDGQGLDAGVAGVRTGGARVQNLEGQQTLLGTTSSLRVGEISNDVIARDAYLRTNGATGEAGVGTLDFGGVRITDAQGRIANERLGVAAGYGGSFSNTNTIEGGRIGWGPDGVQAHADRIAAPGWAVTDGRVDLTGPGGLRAGVSAGDLHQGLDVRDANVRVDGTGVQAHAGSARWDTLGGSNLAANVDLGGVARADARLGSGHYGRIHGENLSLAVDADGVRAGGDNVGYDHVSLRDLEASADVGGIARTNVRAGEVDVLSGQVGRVDLTADRDRTTLTARDATGAVARARDAEVGVGMGGADLTVGAREAAVGEARIGGLEVERAHDGLSGRARVEDARVDALRVEGGRAGLSVGGEQVVGVAGDLRAGGTVGAAEGRFDARAGTAEGRVENANLGFQSRNASVNVLGREVALPDVGANVRANAGGRVNVRDGAAAGNVSLAGSSVNLAGRELRVGDWAQASGDVNVRRGRAAVNVGGQNGVGADVDVRRGNLDLNLFGRRVDVDDGIRRAWRWIRD